MSYVILAICAVTIVVCLLIVLHVFYKAARVINGTDNENDKD